MRHRTAKIVLLAALSGAALFAAVSLAVRAPWRDNSPSATETTHAQNSSSKAGAKLRIVSLSPAITRTLVDFGLHERLVGRSRFCESVEQSITVVGDLHNINYERLIRLQPTHVLVQSAKAGIDPELQRLASAHQWTVQDWPLASLDDIKRMVRELPEVFATQDRARNEALQSRAHALLARMNDVLDRDPSRSDDDHKKASGSSDAGIWTDRTLIVNATDPVMVFGTGTYLHDVLTALGGENAIDAEGWVTLSIEDVVRLEPQAIIIVQPGAEPSVTYEDVAGPLADIDVPAARNGRVAVLRHDDALLPSSAVIDIAETLRTILHRFASASSSPASTSRRHKTRSIARRARRNSHHIGELM